VCVQAMSLCWVATALIRLGVYSSFVQNHLAPSGYVKIPDDLDAYYKGCLFLPKLNNEIASNWNATYKDRLSSLNHLVLIMVCSLFSLIFLEIPFQPIQILFMTCFTESMYERCRVQNIFCSFFMHNQSINFAKA
jgi:hypothetical protein